MYTSFLLIDLKLKPTVKKKDGKKNIFSCFLQLLISPDLGDSGLKGSVLTSSDDETFPPVVFRDLSLLA